MEGWKENVKIRIREELEVAKRRLAAAKLLFEKEMIEDAVNRATTRSSTRSRLR